MISVARSPSASNAKRFRTEGRAGRDVLAGEGEPEPIL